ncbi:MAG: hypothetical protein Q9170_007469, partial [Blastenia crenularia]
MLLCQIPSRIYTLAAAMSPRKNRHPEQQRNLTQDASTFAKLKHYLKKGSKIQSDETRTKPNQDSRRQLYPDEYQTTQGICNDNSPARPGPVPPRGPRQLPRAVHAGARNDRDEVGNESFSSSSITPLSSLTSAQSSGSERARDQPYKKQTPGGLPISQPQPTKSLLNLTSQYASVQNPEKAYNKVQPPASAARRNAPLQRAANAKAPERKISQPVKEVPKNRAQVHQPPTHQRSQKTVVRKMEPQPARRADDRRHMSHVTVFEDFMGHTPPPPIPALPADVSKLVPGPSQASRLSRPFREASEFEKPTNESTDNISPTTTTLSPSESHAETWL